MYFSTLHFGRLSFTFKLLTKTSVGSRLLESEDPCVLSKSMDFAVGVFKGTYFIPAFLSTHCLWL